jgi:NhaP-type Na+/H+ or K+/H+ antiporter
MHEEVVVVVAGVLAVGVVSQWLGWRLRVPSIIFLLLFGLAAGPLTGAIHPDKTFGNVLFPTVSMAVAVILFEGSLSLSVTALRSSGQTLWRLLTIGAGTTLILTVFAARHILDVRLDLATLLASVLVVTGPTVIGPIVQTLGLHGKVGVILEAEGTLIDPIGAVLAVLVFQAAFLTEGTAGDIAAGVVITFTVGGLIGLLAGLLMMFTLSRYVIPDALHNMVMLAVVICTFAIANHFNAESGLVSVTVMGITLATQRRVAVAHVLQFNATLRVLLISGLFVLLAARVDAQTLRSIEWRNIAFMAVLVVVVRPVSVYLSTIGSSLGKRERIFLAATAPRGIVAASVASVFSLQLADIGVENSQILLSATLTVILATVMISGLGSRWLATKLRLVRERKNVFVILGANGMSRLLARALEAHGARVTLIDLDADKLATARLRGLTTYQGSVFASGTWEDVETPPGTTFAAVTAKDELNTLAASRAAEALGRKRVYQLPPGRPEHSGWLQLPTGSIARPLFDREATYTRLMDHLEDGWDIQGVTLDEEYRMDRYEQAHPDAVILFVVIAGGEIDLRATDHIRRPKPGDTVVSLVAPNYFE